MAKRMMLVDAAHPEETRVVVLIGNRIEEFDFETSTKKQIKGNIYLAKVTRVEPSLQAAFVEYGGNRHGFLAFNEIHPDYYRIPVADRRAALEAERLAEQAAAAREDAEREEADRAEAENGGEPAHEDRPFPPNDETDEDDDEPESEGGPERMAHAAPVETIRGPVIEPQDAATPEPPRDETPAGGLFAAPDTVPAIEADRAGSATEAASDGEFGPAPTAPGETPDAAGADAGDSLAVLAESAHEAAAEPHGDAIETVGGDEFEETTRPRARPLRHYKIQEVIKRGQIMLVQVTKEERGNKGAALTTYLSLAGRYCVLMPNTPRGGGVSRKITNMGDRRRLKELMSDLDVPDGMGVIVRTAGSERSKAEIKRDFEYLLRLWDEIRELTLKSSAPALIYEEGNLIKRSIRDLYTRDIEEVIVDGDEGYRIAKAFMKMLMPSHAKRVKLYRDPSVPLFHRFQVEAQIDAIHSPVVQLRSGGYVVINPTEALVAIDVNSGRSTKERNIEETALKTNIEAAEEVARQLRLRDLAGLIVIDFIDMEEYRNRAAVERKLKEAMRHDRARIQLGRISPFGLLELSRQRLRPSLLEASTQPCPYCNGSGHIRSIESTALHVLRAIEEEGMRRRSAEISVAVPTKVALYVLNQKRVALQQAEAHFGFRVTITSDDTLVPPAFRLDRLRAFTPAEIAALPAFVAPPEPEEEEEEIAIDEEEVASIAAKPAPAEPAPERGDGEEGRPRRRRRPRHGRHGDEGRGREAPAPQRSDAALPPPAIAAMPVLRGEEAETTETAEPAPAREPEHGETAGEESKRRRRGRRGGRRRRRTAPQPGETMPAAAAPDTETIEFVAPAPPFEEPAREIADAFAGAQASPETEMEVASIPIAEGDESPRFSIAPEPAPVAPPEPAPAAAAPPSVQYNVPPAHEVVATPANPKRGWWRR
ncbi:MAG TPA: Rne/Rng family ribonuclease [Stellaceae bacterium]|nr:Rne/Rng family ribonuclease [Stellaceae bacterium]